MRRLPRYSMVALAALIAGPILLHASAQACDDRFPSCLQPTAQQEEPPAVEEPTAATEADAPSVRTASPRRHRKARRTAERRAARAQATTPRRSETPARDPDPASIATLPWWQGERPPDQARPVRQTPAQARAGGWIVPAPPASETTATGRPSAETTESAADQVPVANANEVNELDLAVADEPPPVDTAWLHGLLAVLGGALAAGSAARLLLV
jgi:hypothetical protein